MTEKEIIEPKVFQCSLCPFYAAYDRYDTKYLNDSIQPSVTTTKNKKEPSITIDLLETVYLLRDPFVSIKDKDKQDETKLTSVIIGSTCSVCSCPVCVHSDCSLFYTRRFCLKCIAKYRDEFPREILDEIGVKKLDKFLIEDYEQYDEA